MQEQPLDRVLDAIQARGLRFKHSGGSIMAQCPSHADEHCSLSVSIGEDSKVLMHCFAGCETKQVAHDLGLKLADLFPPGANGSTNGVGVAERVYEVRNLAGEVIARHHRQDTCGASDASGPAGKKMWWSRPGVAKGLGGLKVTEIPLYGTELLADAARAEETVVITEGERSADTLRGYGVLALATTTGANKTPSATQLAPLAGREVLLWPDNDKPGRLHMAEMAIKLRTCGAADVRVVEWPDAPPRGDAADWRGTADDLRALLFSSGSPQALIAEHPVHNPDVHVLDPKRTLPTAELFVAAHYDHPEGRTLHAHAGSFWIWRGNRYELAEDEELRSKLLPWLHGQAVEKVTKDGTKLDPFPAHRKTVNDAVDALRSFVFLPASLAIPAWLGDEPAPAPLSELLPCRSATLHVPTGQVLAPTPQLLNTAALEFDYDPTAAAPARWLQFLHEILPEDVEAQDLLQDWFGYCLTADTSQQKALLLVGPRRGGKGTIARVLRNLVGLANVAGPTTSSLAGQFGLQGLIGKSLAVVSDARFSGEHVATVVERILVITGEDAVSIDRKFLGQVTLQLPTRFVFLSNELPRLHDTAGALAGRMLLIRLTESFHGREDLQLAAALREELPGILLWAIDGWRRLRERGRFLEPRSSAEAVQELADLSSPVAAFIRERCVLGSDRRTISAVLYAAWRGWCEADGRTVFGTAQTFGRDLAAACASVRRGRMATGERVYHGIGLANSLPGV